MIHLSLLPCLAERTLRAKCMPPRGKEKQLCQKALSAKQLYHRIGRADGTSAMPQGRKLWKRFHSAVEGVPYRAAEFARINDARSCGTERPRNGARRSVRVAGTAFSRLASESSQDGYSGRYSYRRMRPEGNAPIVALTVPCLRDKLPATGRAVRVVSHVESEDLLNG
jgi:hypothetical protein